MNNLLAGNKAKISKKGLNTVQQKIKVQKGKKFNLLFLIAFILKDPCPRPPGYIAQAQPGGPKGGEYGNEYLEEVRLLGENNEYVLELM